MTKWYPVPPAGRSFRWLGWTTLAGCTLLAVAMLHLVTNNADSSDKPQRDAFAADRPGGERPVEIDNKRVMDYLEAVCKIGPRISGSEGMAKQQKLIEKHFKDLGAKVRYQKFSKKQRTAPQGRRDGQPRSSPTTPTAPSASSSARTTTPAPSPTRSPTSAAGTSRSSAPTTAAPASPC